MINLTTKTQPIQFRISKINFVPSDITLLQSDSNYTIIYLHNGKKVVSSKTLRRFQEQLTEFGFLRVNRQILLNPESISSINPQRAVLKNGQTFLVSRRRRSEFKSKISIKLPV